LFGSKARNHCLLLPRRSDEAEVSIDRVIEFPKKESMKTVLITIAVTVLFWLIIAKAVTGCYTAICKGF
jgi:hypothetical protein